MVFDVPSVTIIITCTIHWYTPSYLVDKWDDILQHMGGLT